MQDSLLSNWFTINKNFGLATSKQAHFVVTVSKNTVLLLDAIKDKIYTCSSMGMGNGVTLD